MRDHKKLRAFELADQLVMLTYKQNAKLPKDELFGLVSQMRRAAVSVASSPPFRIERIYRRQRLAKVVMN